MDDFQQFVFYMWFDWDNLSILITIIQWLQWLIKWLSYKFINKKYIVILLFNFSSIVNVVSLLMVGIMNGFFIYKGY